jgi:hypothetical protein
VIEEYLTSKKERQDVVFIESQYSLTHVKRGLRARGGGEGDLEPGSRLLESWGTGLDPGTVIDC